MATHSGILAWRIPWTEEPKDKLWGKNPNCFESSVERVTHTHTHTHTHTLPLQSKSTRRLQHWWRKHVLPGSKVSVHRNPHRAFSLTFSRNPPCGPWKFPNWRHRKTLKGHTEPAVWRNTNNPLGSNPTFSMLTLQISTIPQQQGFHC